MTASKQGKMAIFPPTTPLKAKIRLPGSKSITNRALLIASLANGQSILSGILKSDDTIVMAKALRLMGVDISDLSEPVVHINASGKLQAARQPLFLGNSGTSTRFLAASAALVNGKTIIDGDEDMQKRPIEPLVNALNSIGVNCTSKTGCPPLTIISNGKPSGTHVSIDASLSSQYISALLMIGPCLNHPFTVSFGQGERIGARGYVDLTLEIMRDFGAKITENSSNSWTIMPTGYKARQYNIAPDYSSITYLWAINKLVKADLDLYPLDGINSQPDARAFKYIEQFPNMDNVIDGSQMQDAIPTLAVLAAFNNKPVKFIGIENLRVKECDRIEALSKGLNAISNGLATEIGNDLIINANPNLKSPKNPVLIDTYNDHRIAMSFALAGLKLNNILIDNPMCVSKTFASYWEVLVQMGVKLEFIK